ncbi:MAG: biotin/lipoyl-containing protein, partial [Candidatus Kapaibacterium sp.]
MATNVVMPKMGESITEGTILRWLKKPGDAVAKDEPILEISTDKVDTEVPAPVAGILLQQIAREKETVAVGALIAVIGQSGEAVSSGQEKGVDVPKNEPQTAAPVAMPAASEVPKNVPETEKAPSKPAPVAASGEGQAVVMPKMGESITEGTILRWLKKEGDTVKKDEPIVEISTDKVDTEVPSPFAGTLTKISAREKETIAVGATLAFISSGSAQTAPAPESKPAAPTAAAQASKPVESPKT